MNISTSRSTFKHSFFWAPLYAHFALRRVYGGGNGSTLLKELGIGALYAAVYTPSVAALAVWVGRGGL